MNKNYKEVKMKEKNSKWLIPLNRIILGLLMLIPGLLKLFSTGIDGVTGMLSGIGFPIPVFFAWILIIAEIGSGIAILSNWKIKYSVIPPMVILFVAAMAFNLSRTSSLLLHLTAIINYAVIAYSK